MAADLFPDAKKECSEFLRHKTYLINPLIVKQKGITVHKCVQYPGEFVITFCGSYHAGFNMGYNCAEAVNFALKRWIDVGKKAGVCKCHSDSVKIDMKSFVGNLEKNNIPRERKSVSPEKKKMQPTAKKVDNWLKCDSCKKWRKIPKSMYYQVTPLGKLELYRKKPFKCNMIKGLSCNTIEENWRKKHTTVKSSLRKSTRKYSKRAVVKV
jgi:hypothetical protein